MGLTRALAGITNIREQVQAIMRQDAWLNVITQLGGSRDKTVHTRPSPVNPIPPSWLSDMYHGDDLSQRMVAKKVQDAFRVLPELDEELHDALKSWQAVQRLREAAIWGRLYGAGAILIGTSDGSPVDSPLGEIREGGLMYLLVIDRTQMSIMDYYQDPADPKFGEPRTYQVSWSAAGGAHLLAENVHESRMIVFGGVQTSHDMRGRNGGFDLSVLQAPYDILRDAGHSWRSIMNVLSDMSQAVFKIDGLIDMISEGNRDVLLQRMEIVDIARSVARAVVVDAEHESFEHVGAANLTGIEPIARMIFQRVAAAAGMPVTVLFGMSPAGMNATGESDIRLWYDSVADYRSDEIETPFARLLEIIAAHEGLNLPDAIEWPSLWQRTDEESAELELKRATAAKAWIDAQVLLPEEVALVEFGGRSYIEVMDLEERERMLAEPEPEPEPPPVLVMPPSPPEPEPDEEDEDEA